MLRLAVLCASVLLLFGCERPEKIKLEKIVFHNSRCFGSCAAYRFEIDTTKLLRIHSEYVSDSPDNTTKTFNPDSSRIGYFIGKVSERKYAELEDELQSIGLDDLQFDGVDCCDGSVKTIIIYYNGKRKTLKSMHPPKEAEKLISLLQNISQSTTTQRTEQAFEIEDE